MVWGGGCGAAAITNAAIAIASGQAQCVFVHHAMAQQDSGRLGYAEHHFDGHMLPYGVGSPAQACAPRTQRMLEYDGVPESAMTSLVLADYFHAQQNPDAAAFGRPLDEQTYRTSRKFVEPYRLYDCSRENDGAVALIPVAADPRRDTASGSGIRAGGQSRRSGRIRRRRRERPRLHLGRVSAGVADALWAAADLGPDQIDVVQVYENFNGSGVAALIDHGLCPPGADAGKVMTLGNPTAPHGLLRSTPAEDTLPLRSSTGWDLSSTLCARFGEPRPIRLQMHKSRSSSAGAGPPCRVGPSLHARRVVN